ncbi:Alpha/Beta hydrolase protein [Mycena vitilis]|nr:Alpha/Beta hydrolase protein [Mycena vitilis]
MGSTSYTEHTVQLPDGIELCYTDSGAPAASSYCTLVVIHGSGFNGDGFVSLHKYAHQNNLRVVALNRRDYRGSTKYTDAELEDLKAGRKIFLDRLAIQLAWFLQQFVNHEGTPKVSVDRKSGGFVILGWSSGVMTALSLFSDPAAIPQALYETVEPYVKNVVLYDPPYSSLGYPQPDYEGWYNPFTDSDYPTPTQMYENFQQWVSSYFTHPDIESGKPSGISHAKRAEKWTTSSWTGEEKATYFDKIAAVRTEAPAWVSLILFVLTCSPRDTDMRPQCAPH